MILINSIFEGSVLFMLILFISAFFRGRSFPLKKSRLIRSVNYALLSGSVFYIMLILIDIVMSFSASEFDQYTVLNRYVGAYWLAIWPFMIVPYGILPQILWFRKLRSSTTASMIVIVYWWFSSLIRIVPHFLARSWDVLIYFDYPGLLLKVIIYIVIIGSLYFFLARKERNSLMYS